MPEKIEVRFIFSADVAFRAPAYYKPARRIMNSLPGDTRQLFDIFPSVSGFSSGCMPYQMRCRLNQKRMSSLFKGNVTMRMQGHNAGGLPSRCMPAEKALLAAATRKLSS